MSNKIKIIKFCDTCDYLNGETGTCENMETKFYGGYMEGEAWCKKYMNGGECYKEYMDEEEFFEKYKLLKEYKRNRKADGDEQLPAATEEKGLILETGQNVRELVAMMRAMADMMRVTNERMAAMEKTIATLEKVTPGQAAEINAGIRTRAAEICQDYRAAGMEKQAAAAIRKDVRNMTGARTAREISRCDYQTVLKTVREWDNYQTMKALRAKGTGK